MNEIINAIELKDGKAVTTSLKIAEVFGKQHKDVLKAIESLQIPDSFRERNFSPSEYSSQNGIGKTIKYPMYIITRDGFTLLAMGFTGKAAMQFKVAYIEAFNAMERTIKESAATGLPTPEVMMSTLYAEMERRIRAEEERDEYKRNLARIARASNLTFGEISAVTRLPKDIVVAAHCKSCRKPHKPQYPKYIQLVFPMLEVLEECRAIGRI